MPTGQKPKKIAVLEGYSESFEAEFPRTAKYEPSCYQSHDS